MVKVGTVAWSAIWVMAVGCNSPLAEISLQSAAFGCPCADGFDCKDGVCVTRPGGLGGFGDTTSAAALAVATDANAVDTVDRAVDQGQSDWLIVDQAEVDMVESGDAVDSAGETSPAPRNAVGCPATGTGGCGGNGKGTCDSGHCYWTDTTGYKWTLVPAGKFWMGCNPVLDSSCTGTGAELPQHEVDLSAYWIGVYEVTATQYKACVTATFAGCSVPATTGGSYYSTYATTGKEQHPVNYVTWAQSQAVCKYLGGDLPTEAQWEKAARGGCEVYAGKDCKTSEPRYPWGSAAPVCGTNSVYYTSNSGCGTNSTYAVGVGSQQGQSPYAAYDMAGNVWEWVLDWHDAGFYGKAGAAVKDPVNATSTSDRVFRGGSLLNPAPYLRAGFRNGGVPAGSDDYLVGVRCSRSVP